MLYIFCNLAKPLSGIFSIIHIYAMQKLTYCLIFSLIIISMSLVQCTRQEEEQAEVQDPMDQLLAKYAPVTLDADLSHLSENQKTMLKKLIEVADIMDGLFLEQAWGDTTGLADTLDAKTREFLDINYGPWDRLDGNNPFVEGVGPKPKGANFYPSDITISEFEEADLPGKRNLYTLIRRDTAGTLTAIPYSIAYAPQLQDARRLMLEAADLADDPAFSRYLRLRANALLTNDYIESDLAWMDMLENPIDFIVGPIETYEDQLFGYKAAFEAYILLKDKAWTQRLKKYAAMLPDLQKALPVEAKYKAEKPGTDGQLAAFDVLYYAGDCNSGSKTIAVNLPNDEQVQLKKGTRRSQLKNAMKAKFDQILLPIADDLIDQEQRDYINFDAFFSNTMFHEVAHGLGIKNVIGETMTVRESLRDHASAIEEGKADILGLFIITRLIEMGELEGDLENYYTTFMAGIFRSVRFGAASAHGKANMICFNYFHEQEAFIRQKNGRYKVDYEKMKTAVEGLSNLILTIQGDGDYSAASELVKERGVIKNPLRWDLESLAKKGIPVDIIFEQGSDVLGL